MWNILRDVRIRLLKGIFSKVLAERKMSRKLRKSLIVPILKGKGNVK